MCANKISIVIVEYNSVEEIARVVGTIKSCLPDAEVIISSNSMYGEDKCVELQQQFSDCRWIFNEKNGGFAYAMNRGLEVASGDFLVISNPDCVFKKGIDQMADFLLKHPEVGAIAPQIIDEDGNIQDSVREYVSLPRFIARQLKRIIFNQELVLDPKIDYKVLQTVDWAIGAFIMVSRKAYALTGGLCEDYFMYAEDLDWCTRIREAGLEIVYYPDAQIVYKGSRSARRSSLYMKIFLKSHLTYWRRYGLLWGYPKRRDYDFK